MSPARQVASAPRFLQLPEVMLLTGYCRTGVYKAVLAQLLPAPVKIGRSSRWPEDEVLALRAALLQGYDERSRRLLVRQLRAARGVDLPAPASDALQRVLDASAASAPPVT